jgi:hypothetical protein
MKQWLIIWALLASTQFISAQQKTIPYSQLADELFVQQKETIQYKDVFFKNDLTNKGKEFFLSDYWSPVMAWYILGGFRSFLDSKGIQPEKNGYFHSRTKIL